MDNSGMTLERAEAAVRRVLAIEDITPGDERSGYLVRYRGRLFSDDSAAAYEQLNESVKPLGLTPIFRMDEDRHSVLLVNRVASPSPSNPRVNLIFFILTLISVWFTGGMMSVTELSSNWLENLQQFIVKGWPFTVSMLGILGAHEFGHYLAGRYHKVQVTLPYFIPLPFPFSPFGTLGAFINMKEMPRNRRILLDIGIAGPIAGLVVAIPVLLIGLSMSPLTQLPAAAAAGGVGQTQLEGNSIIYLLAKYTIFGQLLPAPVSFEGLSPVVYWLRYFFTGQPLPYGGLDVSLDPVAWAGWGGMLITALNLIPAGQLDGGHMIYTLLGRKGARRLLPIVLAALVVLGFVWTTWWFWAALIFLLGRVYAEPLDTITQLDGRRKMLAILALVIFVLVFTPVPLVLML
ncbi:MAG TPA: site-2 protease family protein [Bellilinea sp.]|nr:site-2 protease family protein [Bellilinea sp.]